MYPNVSCHDHDDNDDDDDDGDNGGLVIDYRR